MPLRGLNFYVMTNRQKFYAGESLLQANGHLFARRFGSWTNLTTSQVFKGHIATYTDLLGVQALMEANPECAVFEDN